MNPNHTKVKNQPDSATESNMAKVYVATVATVLAAFSLYGAYRGVFSDMIQRPAHIGLILMLVYGGSLFTTTRGNARFRVLSAVFLIVSIVVMGYHIIFHDAVAARYGELTKLELYLGLAAMIVLLEATRRSIGWSIVVLAIIFLLYAYFGNLLPGGNWT